MRLFDATGGRLRMRWESWVEGVGGGGGGGRGGEKGGISLIVVTLISSGGS